MPAGVAVRRCFVDIREYLAGSKLFGDDFSPEELADWYRDEAEAYAQLVATEHQAEKEGYSYHALNAVHGFSAIPDLEFNHALGIGSAFGFEFERLASRIHRITIVDPSFEMRSASIAGVPVRYVKPRVEGDLPFSESVFDLVTCFGTLHHIPNVSKVVGEIHRCLVPGSYVLIREPIVSMGDWRLPRHGLTKRERGIPLGLFRRIARRAGFQVVRERLCMCPLISRLQPLMRERVYNSEWAVKLDGILCRLLAWNLHYHATHAYQKVSPSSVFFVLRKP